MIIAIDGPAASGKGTLARRLAAHYGLNHLDTGLTYRAVAAALLEKGLPLDDEETAARVAGEVDLGALDREALSLHEVGEAASKIAVMGKVRTALVKAQQRFAHRDPGAVLDGRDIGTVVCPDADAKLFVEASAEVRARRRTDEMAGRGKPADYAEVLADLERRDARDRARAVAPLKKAEDAHLLDTSDLDIETAFRKAVELIDRVRNAN
ncbi:cytidylate kinase [Rhodobium orientis]|uniref:Cytidylate kinase n=1 Tax=Rhodobium orientis TaxID=34017 RepID=A0A327JM67_9HYPH|nr:(d)CMP kinase [Rhodobium orientis]MBB4305622.1 cytidylate kinase [Rhodobium orientis]MBK5948721.1 cytidylate kinase [Rhodobium orientis]RAI24518.1 cytidylate kinase [Rhodobium orientis]